MEIQLELQTSLLCVCVLEREGERDGLVSSVLVSALVTCFNPMGETEREREKLNKKINKITTSNGEMERKSKRKLGLATFSASYTTCVMFFFKMPHQVKNSALKNVFIHTISVSAAVVTYVSILEPVSVRKRRNGHF